MLVLSDGCSTRPRGAAGLSLASPEPGPVPALRTPALGSVAAP